MGAKLNSSEHRRRILLVDPNHETFMRLILLLDEGAPDQYTMDWAATFRFGTSLLNRNEYDLVLVGSRLGFHTGHEFVQAARQVIPALPLIMLQKPVTSIADKEQHDDVWDCFELDHLESSALMASIQDACAARPNT